MKYPWKLTSYLFGLQAISFTPLMIIIKLRPDMSMGFCAAGYTILFVLNFYMLFRWILRPLAHVNAVFNIPLFQTDPIDASIENDDDTLTPFEWAKLEQTALKLKDRENTQAADLTQERDELSLLMASISDAIVAIDLEERFLFLNSKFILMFGQSKIIPANLKLAEVIRNPLVLDAFRKSLQKSRQYQVPVTLTTNTEVGDRDFSLSITSLQRRDGQIYGAVGIFHDVSDLKKAERVRIEFVANVSHELRTPLTSIKGYTDTLALDLAELLTEKPETKKFFGIIQQNVQRLMALIEDLLDLSSLESNFEFHKESVLTQKVTLRILEQLESKINSKKQVVVTYFESDKVFADEKRVEQVLTNLIDNAHKYSPHNSKIELYWVRVAGGVELRVKDFGPGIPTDSLPRLFERFYRVDKGRSRELGGTGLGLAIVKHILIKHGGRVWAESQITQGSTFRCFFPDSETIGLTPEKVL